VRLRRQVEVGRQEGGPKLKRLPISIRPTPHSRKSPMNRRLSEGGPARMHHHGSRDALRALRPRKSITLIDLDPALGGNAQSMRNPSIDLTIKSLANNGEPLGVLPA
jgi:hypothetical protein